MLLEAGKQESIDSFINDEWASFAPARLARQAHHLGQLAGGQGLPEPAGLDLQDRGRHHHALGRRLAALPGARVQGPHGLRRDRRAPTCWTGRSRWPELEPYYARAEDKMGVTRTNGIPGLPGNNNFKVMYTGAKRLGYKEVHTGRMAINSEPRHDRPSCQQIGFCFQGCKSSAKWSTLYTEIPAARRPASSSCGPSATCCRSSTTPPARSPACSTPTRTASSTSRRRASSASPATRSRARACSSTRPRPSSRTGSPTARARSAGTTCGT